MLLLCLSLPNYSHSNTNGDLAVNTGNTHDGNLIRWYSFFICIKLRNPWLFVPVSSEKQIFFISLFFLSSHCHTLMMNEFWCFHLSIGKCVEVCVVIAHSRGDAQQHNVCIVFVLFIYKYLDLWFKTWSRHYLNQQGFPFLCFHSLNRIKRTIPLFSKKKKKNSHTSSTLDALLEIEIGLK